MNKEKNSYFDDKKLYDLIFQDDFNKVVDFLNKYGLNSRDRDDATFLMSCVVEDKIDFVKKLIELGVDINLQSSNGFTALHFAAQENKKEIFDLLLSQNNIKIDIKDNWGNTTLLRLVEEEDEKKIELIKKLINKGASLDIENNYGVSPRIAMHEITDEGIVDYSPFLE